MMKRNLEGKKAILYRRVSTTDQKINGNSLSTQRDALRRFADSNGIVVLKEFEEDHSAKDFERPAFNKLRAYARQYKTQIDLILLTDWDRFSRNLVDGLIVMNEMKSLGIEINSINNWSDNEDPFSEFFRNMQIGTAELENKIKSKKVKDNMRQGLKEGRWNRSQPKGYMPGKDPENPRRPLMQIDPEIGPLIKDLFIDYSLGIYSQNQLREMEKYKPLRLSKSNLSRMLTNVLYAGKILIPEYDKEREQLIDGLHEPLIDWNTFEQVQYQIGRRRRFKQKSSKLNENFPLRGHLGCPRCGGNLTGSPSKSKTGALHYYYHCNPRKGCNIRFKVADLHSEFNSTLQSFEVPTAVVNLFKAIVKEKFEIGTNTRGSRIRALEHEIRSLKERQDKLLNKLLDETITDQIFRDHNKKLENEITSKRSRLKTLGSFQNEIIDYTDFAVNLLVNFRQLFENSDVNIKDLLLSSILEEKLVFDGKKYRTPKFKSGIASIYLSVKNLDPYKIKTGDSFSTISRKVQKTGLEPVRTFLSTGF